MLIYSPIKTKPLKKIKKIPLKQVLGSIIAISVITAIAMAYYINSEGYTRQKMMNDTKQLRQTVESLSDSLDTTSPPTNPSLKQYLSNLQDINAGCGRLKQDLVGVEKHNYSEAFSSQGKKSMALCDDLVSVSNYSKDIYTSVGDFLTAKPDQENSLIEKSNELILITSNTVDSFGNVRNNIDDPAYDEIKTQLNASNTLSLDTKKLAETSPADTQILVERLEKVIVAQQEEIWQRRIYFWNNTVVIKKLIQTLKNQEEGW